MPPQLLPTIIQMQLPEVNDNCGSQKGRILTWMEALEPGSPEALKPRHNLRKRPCGQHNSITSPSKRKASNAPTKRQPLALASRNIMSPRKGKGQTPQGKKRQSPRKRQRTAPPDTNEYDQDENEELDQETPKVSRSMRIRGRTLEPGIQNPIRLPPPPVYNRPQLATASASLPTRSSISNSNQSEGLSNARSTSPVKQFADLNMAERPTTLEGLNGETAERASGVLENYKDLVAIGRGIGVIPQSLKVSGKFAVKV